MAFCFVAQRRTNSGDGTSVDNPSELGEEESEAEVEIVPDDQLERVRLQQQAAATQQQQQQQQRSQLPQVDLPTFGQQRKAVDGLRSIQCKFAFSDEMLWCV